MRDRLTDEEYETLREEANDVLAAFVTPTGTAAIPIDGHLVAARPAGPEPRRPPLTGLG